MTDSMREVRMTFGEHLEDLRKRMFFALGWLAFAVGICFYFGNDLLAWALGPHKVAIRGAIRERSIVVLGQKGNDLLELTRNPPGPEGAEPIVTSVKVPPSLRKRVLSWMLPGVLPPLPRNRS